MNAAIKQPSSINWPAVIAGFVALIGLQQYLLARQQHSLAKEKFKLDLFEKRFAVYKAAKNFLVAIMRDPKMQASDVMDFLRETQDAEFLFGSEIVAYIDSLYKGAISVQNLQLRYGPLPVGPERSELCNEELKLLRDLTNEITKVNKVFSPYLGFKGWK